MSAKEIYCSLSLGTFFKIEDGIIKVYDFEDTYYEYDLNGMLVKEIPAETNPYLQCMRRDGGKEIRV